MKYTEGGFRAWGYALAEREFGDRTYTWEQWGRTKEASGEEAANAEQKKALAAGKLLIKDAIADITLQQVLTRPDEFDVIATLNLNGDYLSDALAAQVGGIGIAPGGNINYLTGHAVFEATHGTAPKYANLDKVNPGSVVLSGRDDAALHGLDRSGGPDHQGHGRRDRQPEGDLRFRAADGRRDGGEHDAVRRRDHRAHGLGPAQDRRLALPAHGGIPFSVAQDFSPCAMSACATSASIAPQRPREKALRVVERDLRARPAGDGIEPVLGPGNLQEHDDVPVASKRSCSRRPKRASTTWSRPP